MAPKPPGSNDGAEGDETYQLDVVVSLFAIMLVILVALAAAAVSGGETRLAYRPKDNAPMPYALRSIAVPYRYREIWGLVEARLVQVDTAAAARVAAEAAEQNTSGFTVGNVDGEFELTKGGVGAYRLSLSFFDEPMPGGLVRRIIDVEDRSAVADWANESGGVAVVVLESGQPYAGIVSQALEHTQRPHSIGHSQRNRITLTRNAANFAYDRIMRAY